MAAMKFAEYILKRLFKKPATLMYPVVKREYCERTRGHIDIDINACIFCGICSRKCPTNAIEVTRNDKTWAIERLRCIQCGSCVENCPKKCLSMGTSYTPPSSGSVKDVFDARVSNNPEDH